MWKQSEWSLNWESEVPIRTFQVEELKAFSFGIRVGGYNMYL